jgi:formate dehydrogenase maturation protein FdhE
MTSTANMLASLTRQRPEWTPWLAVIEEVLHEAEEKMWDSAVPGVGPVSGNAPRLAQATVVVEKTLVSRLFRKLVRTAARSGTPGMATLARVTEANADVLEVFRASLCHDADRIAAIAASCDAEPDAFQAVVALLPFPFLQSCNAAWGSASAEDWPGSYCPVCGSWPAFAEIRGIERSRSYRCGRCGSEWHAHGLACPYCATTNHRDLVELVPEKPGSAGFIDACKQCLGYIKAFNRLQACAPLAVMLEDLKGAALDVAALEQGYARPAGAGYRLNVVVTGNESARRTFLAWNG